MQTDKLYRKFIQANTHQNNLLCFIWSVALNHALILTLILDHIITYGDIWSKSTAGFSHQESAFNVFVTDLLPTLR